MFQITVVDKIKTHFMFGNFFCENRALYGRMWKKCRTSHAIDDNIGQRIVDAICMPDNLGKNGDTTVIFNC